MQTLTIKAKYKVGDKIYRRGTDKNYRSKVLANTISGIAFIKFPEIRIHYSLKGQEYSSYPENELFTDKTVLIKQCAKEALKSQQEYIARQKQWIADAVIKLKQAEKEYETLKH